MSEYQACQQLNDSVMRRALWMWLQQQRPDLYRPGTLPRAVLPPPGDDQVIADLRRILLPSRHWWQRLFE